MSIRAASLRLCVISIRPQKDVSLDVAILAQYFFMHPSSGWSEVLLWVLLDPSPTALLLLFILALLASIVLGNMPSVIGNSPFLSLRPDNDCGRSKVQEPAPTSKSFSSLSPQLNGVNGHHQPSLNGLTTVLADRTNGINGTANGTNGINGHSHDDEFLRLESPQQDILLLHGPRQKYSLEKAKDIPELHKEDEILVQILAIGEHRCPLSTSGVY